MEIRNGSAKPTGLGSHPDAQKKCGVENQKEHALRGFGTPTSHY
jgi:hypothetical protein